MNMNEQINITRLDSDEEEFGSFEGAVPADSIPAAAVPNIPLAPIAAAVDVERAAQAQGEQASPEAPRQLVAALPPMEAAGFLVPGPVPMLCRAKPKGIAIPLALLPEAEARVAMFSDIASQLAAQLEATTAEAATLYATSRRAERALAVAVDLLSRLHQVVINFEEDVSVGAASAYHRMAEILSEDNT
jgi:hypothetical protein